MIILDTEVVIEVTDKDSDESEQILERLEAAGDEVVITSLNLHEILYGFHQYGKERIKSLELLPVLRFEHRDAVLSADIEIAAERRGQVLSRIDAMIAAMAINRKAKLFTFNRKNFENIPDLELF